MGMGSGLAGAVADTVGISTFTSALGTEKKSADKPKSVEPKAFDEDESPTKVLQRILDEMQSIHKVMASQVVPPSEEEEIERKKDKKDEEVLDALGNIVPKEDEKDKKKKPWWKMLWDWISPFIKFILKPLSWIKSLLSLPFIIGLGSLLAGLTAFFLFNPIGIALLAIGIVAVNWKAIKKAIKGYVNTIKGWIRTALSEIGIGSVADRMFGKEEVVEEEPMAPDAGMDDTMGEEDAGRASSDFMIEAEINQLGIPDTTESPDWVEPEKVP